MKRLFTVLIFSFTIFSNTFGQKISLIKNINNSPDPSINFFFSTGAFLNSNTFIFIASDGISGPELWSTDGTEAGTKMIKDIYPGITPSDIYGVTKVNNKVVFAANNGANGSELWVSDGSVTGTFMLTDIVPGNFSSNISLFVPANGKVYFVYYDFSDTYIWETDGTINGTKSAIEFTKGSGTKISSVFAVNNGFIFEIYDSKTDKQGLYFSDGTKAGTRFIIDVNPIAGYNGRLEINDFVKLANNRYVFACRTSGTSEVPTLFSTDLTAAGTIQLATMN